MELVSKRHNSLTIAALGCFFILIFASRLHLYGQPIERDLGVYAVHAHAMLKQGRQLYADLWDQKPPATVVTFAAAELLFGYGDLQIFALGLISAVATLLLVFFITDRLCELGELDVRTRRWTALTAAGLWAATCTDLGLQSNQPNVEAYMNVACCAALLLMLRPRSAACALLAGIAWAIATLYKQIAVLPAAAGYLALFLAAARWHGRFRRKRIALNAVIAFLIAAAGWAATALYFQFRGTWHDFYRCVFAYNQSYALSYPPNFLGLRFTLPAVDQSPMLWMLLIGVGGSVALCWQGRVSKPFRASLYFILAVFVGTYIEVILPRRAYPHYYQLLVPCGVIALAFALTQVAMQIKQRSSLKVSAGLLAVILALVESPQFSMNADDWSQHQYGTEFIQCKRLAHQLDRLLEPEETFYQFGPQSTLYFYADRFPPSGITYLYPAVENPTFTHEVLQRIRRQMEAHPPDLMLLDRPTWLMINSFAPAEIKEFGGWVKARYVPMERPFDAGYFTFFARKNSRLAPPVEPATHPAHR